ncbi:ferredoxin [Nocardia arizonensis]|uniref:ferredoxin n=1 Tax=Nocardia arizonensis TaxID=1141647 RepID=UPI0006D12270|nr:ferredoxin [Nocardia arizonensis]
METNAQQIEVTRERCIGSGLCLIRAADFFSVDDAGYVVADFATIEAADDADSIELIRDAVESCPSGAIAYRRRTDR